MWWFGDRASAKDSVAPRLKEADFPKAAKALISFQNGQYALSHGHHGNLTYAQVIKSYLYIFTEFKMHFVLYFIMPV